MRAMILAAGRGERLRPLTDTTPKALVDVGGTSLLERHLQRLQVAGVTDVVINVDWLGEQIIERIGDGTRYGVNVSFSPEFGNVLETAGGIQKALPMLGDAPFWVVNADVFTDAVVPEVGLPDSIDGHLLMVPTPSFKRKGDFDIAEGLLRNSDNPKFTFSGIACYHPRFFAGLKPGRAALAPLLRTATDEGRLTAAMLAGSWDDVGTAERLEQVRDANAATSVGD
jgi:MurNAc alpha-1-phosphate uridylyltransferase